MQINNNYTSPNFGMALKINPKAEEALKKLPEKTLQQLVDIGKDLKDTKYCDLVVDEAGKYIVNTHSAIKLQDIVSAGTEGITPEFLRITGTYTGVPTGTMQPHTKQTFTYIFPDSTSASAHFKAINSAGSGLEKAVATVKAIEASSAYKAVKAEEEEAQKTKINSLVGDLLSQFSENA